MTLPPGPVGRRELSGKDFLSDNLQGIGSFDFSAMADVNFLHMPSETRRVTRFQKSRERLFKFLAIIGEEVRKSNIKRVSGLKISDSVKRMTVRAKNVADTKFACGGYCPTGSELCGEKSKGGRESRLKTQR